MALLAHVMFVTKVILVLSGLATLTVVPVFDKISTLVTHGWGSDPVEDTRPNIIIFFADDMGWGDVGANNPDIKDTPNIDNLAANGLRFTDFHSGAAVCTPSRASLMTARLGLRTGAYGMFNIGSYGGLPLNETTMAETFKSAGYKTALIGKWHLGVHGKHHPSHRGFDYYFGTPSSNDAGCVDKPGINLPEQTACLKGSGVNSSTWYWNVTHTRLGNGLVLYEDEKILEQPVNLWGLNGRYEAKASNFIDESVKAKTPFLLYMAFNHMHVPLAYDDQFTNTSTLGAFGDTLRELDHAVGNVVRTLDKNQVSNNTLVWFTSDNGPWEMKCYYAGSTGPFKGSWQKNEGGGGSSSKKTVWEGGHRVPGIAYWPGRIEPGESDALLTQMDIFPTIASIAGVKMPAFRKFDGIDISKLLLEDANVTHEILYHPNSGGDAAGQYGQIDAIRYGNYKAVYVTGGQPECDGTIGSVQSHYPPLLFKLTDDQAESDPLDPTEPDNKAILQKIATAFLQIYDDIRTDNTTVANYTQSFFAGPCCNTRHVCCRCDNLQ